jgi:hypothetical protein
MSCVDQMGGREPNRGQIYREKNEEDGQIVDRRQMSSSQKVTNLV